MNECRVCGDRRVATTDGLCQWCADKIDLRTDAFGFGATEISPGLWMVPASGSALIVATVTHSKPSTSRLTLRQWFKFLSYPWRVRRIQP